MKILAVNKLQDTNNPKAGNTQKVLPQLSFGIKLKKPLTQDTLTISEKNGGSFKISDVIVANLRQDEGRIQRLATTYLDVLESIANKLKEFGVSFDREYCEKHPVKSTSAYLSKIIRSGKFNVPDHIRATLYVKNAYDLSILNDHILPELEKRDFILAKTEGNLKELITKGYEPKLEEISGKKDPIVPDLDIRLADVSDQIGVLNPELRYCIGKPQASGYEDIQLRLVRGFDKKRKPVLHELIIIFGPNYSYAKDLVSKKIYSNIRLFKETNVMLQGDEKDPNYILVKRYIDLIKKLFACEFSEKLFENAKNLDLYGIDEYNPIKLSAKNIKLLKTYFSELEKNLNEYYKKVLSKKTKNSTRHKTIVEWKEDRSLIKMIKAELNETVEFFNKEDYLKAKPNKD